MWPLFGDGRAVARLGVLTAKRCTTGGKPSKRTAGLGKNEVGVAEIAAYRDRMLGGPSDHTGRSFARSTINGRLRTLAQFYPWCVSAGLIEGAPFMASEVALSRSWPQGFLAHINASAGRQVVNEMTVRHTPMLPRPLSPSMLRRVMAGMGSRDRLIVEWAVTTGIRRMEVADCGGVRCHAPASTL